MTKLFNFLLLIFLSTNISAQKSDLLGVWEIYQVDNLNTAVTNKTRGKYLRLLMDGKLQGGNYGESPQSFGSWYYHEESKTVTISSEDGNLDDGNYTIVKLKRKKLILESNKQRIYLDRGLSD